MVGDPVRVSVADRDGRFCWDLPMANDRVTRILMPGVELVRVRDDLTAQAPCLFVNNGTWWWTAAMDMAIPVEHGSGGRAWGIDLRRRVGNRYR